MSDDERDLRRLVDQALDIDPAYRPEAAQAIADSPAARAIIESVRLAPPAGELPVSTNGGYGWARDRVGLDDGNAIAADAAPFAVSLYEFIGQDEEPPVPLLGDERNAIIPAGGLVVIAGRPGVGKTTLALDLAFHLAAGRDWLGFQVPRPLCVLLVENEGPKAMFRAKLAAKNEHFGPLDDDGAIYVQTWRWGHFSFRTDEARARAAQWLELHGIDVVLGDPLGTLGIEGVGSPEDVRNFVALLPELGLMERRAFVFLHHFRHRPDRETATDEVAQLQGVWGGALDTLVTVKPTQSTEQVRFHIPKLRWGVETFKPVLLGLVRNTAAFELLGDEDDPRLLEQDIIALLGDGKWRTRDEIAITSKGGIGARKTAVEAALVGNAHIFQSAAGNEHGRSPKATLWQLAPEHGASRGESASDGARGTGPTVPLPVGDGGGASAPSDPPRDPELDWPDEPEPTW